MERKKLFQLLIVNGGKCKIKKKEGRPKYAININILQIRKKKQLVIVKELFAKNPVHVLL